jgi:hypothetical protein
VAEPFVVGRKVGGGGSNSPSRDNSLDVAATQRYREAHEEENNKTRIKDIIRRDLLFYPTFRNALQGNSERTEASQRYSELYERYKDLYAPLLYDDPEDSDWANDTDREDSLFLSDSYDPKRGTIRRLMCTRDARSGSFSALSMFGCAHSCFDPEQPGNCT